MYGRYWNGYLLIVKPLLYFFDYYVFRYINSVFQLLLFGLIIFLLVKKGKQHLILPYILSLLMIMPFALVLCIQQTTCYTIFNLGVVLVLLCDKSLDKKGIVIFLYLGIMTSFFDLLSYPLVTFGVPAVFYFCLVRQDGVKQMMLRFVKIGAAWCFGYAGMWIGKWLVGGILTGKNLVQDALQAASLRAGNDLGVEGATENITVFGIFSNNIKSFILTPVTLIVFVFIVTMLILLWRKRKQFSAKDCWQSFVPFLCLSVLPFIWYMALQNHSFIHHGIYCSKVLMISVLAVSCFCCDYYRRINNPTVNE